MIHYSTSDLQQSPRAPDITMPQKCCGDDLNAKVLHAGIDPVSAPGCNVSIQFKSLKVDESMAAPHDVAEEDMIECIYDTISNEDYQAD